MVRRGASALKLDAHFVSRSHVWINWSEFTYFECKVLYIRMPSARPHTWIRSSLDMRSTSAPVNCENVLAYWPRRCIFIHWANAAGVASFEIFVELERPHELLKSSLSTGWCCGGETMLCSIIFMVELDDDTLFIPIGFAGLLLDEKTPSNFVLWIGEFDISGDPDADVRILRQKRNKNEIDFSFSGDFSSGYSLFWTETVLNVNRIAW